MTEPSGLELWAYQDDLIAGRRPSWWHHCGGQLRLAAATDDRLTLVSPHASLQVHRDDQSFLVTWEIRPTGSVDPYVERTIHVSPAVLGMMFKIDEDRHEEYLWHGQHLVTEYSEQHFVRWHRYLNLIYPGSGQDGDPNLSVYLFDSIRQAAAALVHAAL